MTIQELAKELEDFHSYKCAMEILTSIDEWLTGRVILALRLEREVENRFCYKMKRIDVFRKVVEFFTIRHDLEAKRAERDKTRKRTPCGHKRNVLAYEELKRNLRYKISDKALLMENLDQIPSRRILFIELGSSKVTPKDDDAILKRINELISEIEEIRDEIAQMELDQAEYNTMLITNELVSIEINKVPAGKLVQATLF